MFAGTRMLPELPNCALNCSDLHLPIRISEYLSILRSADKKCYRLKGDGNGDRVPLFSVWEVVHASIQLFFFFNQVDVLTEGHERHLSRQETGSEGRRE